VSASHQISGAVFIDPSQQQSETSAEWTQRVREAVMQVVYQWHHSGDPHPLEVTRCSVVPYSTCDDPCSSVSHVIVAPVAVIFELVTEEIVGAVVSLTAF
jgi:hypothetical protein